jgi:hypothetical protein
VTATVKVSNTGPSPLNAFVDPRLTTRTLYDLLPVSQATGVTLPLNTAVAPPEWVVPTQTNLLDAAAQATAPITFDWGFLDPDIEAVSSGDNAYSAFATPEATPGAWFMAPSLIGPDSGVTSGTVNTGIAAQALTFDGSVTSSTGDPQLADVNPSPPAANPVAINPGSSSTISVTFTPSAPSGTVVHGYLYVDDDIAELGAVNEITAIPYEYKVG